MVPGTLPGFDQAGTQGLRDVCASPDRSPRSRRDFGSQISSQGQGHADISAGDGRRSRQLATAEEVDSWIAQEPLEMWDMIEESRAPVRNSRSRVNV